MIDPYRFGPWVSAKAAAYFEQQAANASAPRGDLAALREYYDAFNRRQLDIALANYAVDRERSEMSGVSVDIVTPTGGATLDGTLLCLHGGAFMWGRGAGALLEAVPVAEVTGMRVIAVEYALAPEHIYPAAVDDVLAVYRALLATEAPGRIGIYGCSAGGILTSQAVSRMIAQHMPLPGAIAMLCGAGLEMAGDSAQIAGAFAVGPGDEEPATLSALPYFTGADLDDPLVFPGEHTECLSEFPPSLLITGSRDFAASSVTTMHRRLLAAGAQAELIQFDGMWHAHHMATTLPEARETFAALGRFFSAYLV